MDKDNQKSERVFGILCLVLCSIWGVWGYFRFGPNGDLPGWYLLGFGIILFSVFAAMAAWQEQEKDSCHINLNVQLEDDHATAIGMVWMFVIGGLWLNYPFWIAFLISIPTIILGVIAFILGFKILMLFFMLFWHSRSHDEE